MVGEVEDSEQGASKVNEETHEDPGRSECKDATLGWSGIME